MNFKKVKMKKIKTFEDACKTLKYDAKKTLPDFSSYPEKDRSALECHAKLVIIVDAINRIDNDGEEWFPDWDNSSEYKYYPWFRADGSSGFRYYDCDDWSAIADVGSRLCFKKSDSAKYVGEHFSDLYESSFMKASAPEVKPNCDGKTVEIDGVEYVLNLKK
ncbi:MAG: hypothetical protein ACI9AT_002041 [Ulvibacter sp.]|jgi:hypothetical protein